MDQFLAPSGLAAAALLSFRVGGLMWVAPIFSSRAIPMRLKAAFTVLLVALLWDPPAADAVVRVTAGSILSELLIGGTLGLGAAIFLGAAESAGDTLAVQMGLSGANVLDPMSQTHLPVLGQLLSLFVTTLILATGGHLVILAAVAASIDALPLGGSVDVVSGSWAAISLGGTLLALGLRFAAPVVGAMIMGNIALGIMSRAVPQLNVLVVAFPVQIATGLFVLAVTLPLIAMSFYDWPDAYRAVTGGVMDALIPDAAGGS